MKKTLKIEIFSRFGMRGRRWYFRIRAVNGKTLAQSEGYHNKADAISTAIGLRAGLLDAEISHYG
jgi:hypothetical protein